MACKPTKCGLVKTDFGPLGPITVTATSGPLAGRQVHFQDVVDEATTLLQQAVDNAKQTEPDPDMPKCDNGCACAGVVWTPRPPDSVPFTVTFTVNDISYEATANVNRTISDGVGRCAPEHYSVAAGRIPEMDLTVAVSRRQPITGAELAKVGEILKGGRDRKV